MRVILKRLISILLGFVSGIGLLGFTLELFNMLSTGIFDLSTVVFFLVFLLLIVAFIVWNVSKSKIAYFLFAAPVLIFFGTIPVERILNVMDEAAALAERAERRSWHIEWLRENRAYPHGFFVRGSDIMIVAIEDDSPVVKQVDIYNGELITLSESRLDRITPYTYFTFSSEGWHIIFEGDTTGYLFQRGAGVRLRTRFLETTSNNIPDEVFFLTSYSQRQFEGSFVFDSFQIIRNEGYENWEARAERYTDLRIEIEFDEQYGRLISEQIIAWEDSSFNVRQGRRLWTDVADGPFGGSGTEWFFADENTIYRTHHSDRFNEIDGARIGHSIEYTVRLIREVSPP